MFGLLRRLDGPPLAPLLLLAVATAGCEAVEGLTTESPPAPKPKYPVSISVFEDDRRPVEGAEILSGKKTAGTTDAAGTVKLSLTGQEGSTVQLHVKCPEAFASPEKPITVGLRRLAAGALPTFEAQCVPLTHTVVVGIRTENGKNLPIVRLGKVVGETDAAGVAHVLLKASANEQVTLKLDTSDNAALRPQNPLLTFVTKDRDEEVLLEQRFTVVRKVYKPPPAKPRPKPL